MCILVCVVRVVLVVLVGVIIRVCCLVVVVSVVGSILLMLCSLLVRVSLLRNLWLLSVCGLIWLLVVRMFSVMVRLKWLFFLGRLVGVRLMVMCCCGNLNWV